MESWHDYAINGKIFAVFGLSSGMLDRDWRITIFKMKTVFLFQIHDPSSLQSNVYHHHQAI